MFGLAFPRVLILTFIGPGRSPWTNIGEPRHLQDRIPTVLNLKPRERILKVQDPCTRQPLYSPHAFLLSNKREEVLVGTLSPPMHGNTP